MIPSEDSTAQWIERLQYGDHAAAQQLFQDIYERLLRLARMRLGRRTLRWADEEDIALSVFDSFCRRAAAKQFATLRNRNDLWKLLVRMTSRKTKDYVRAHLAMKRGGGLTHGDSAFVEHEGGNGGLEAAIIDEYTPVVRAAVAEECRRLLAVLDVRTQSIAIWKLEGYSDGEIAERLGCVRRTVVRKLNYIRDKWKRMSEAN